MMSMPLFLGYFICRIKFLIASAYVLAILKFTFTSSTGSVPRLIYGFL